jgi:hypothetical protein
VKPTTHFQKIKNKRKAGRELSLVPNGLYSPAKLQDRSYLNDLIAE